MEKKISKHQLSSDKILKHKLLLINFPTKENSKNYLVAQIMKIIKIQICPILFFFFQLSCASVNGGKIATVSNRNVEYVLIENKNPVVIFENGLGGQYHWWSKVFPLVSKHYTSFAYNRAGYGQSSMSSTTRNGIEIIEELRATLQSLQLKPPYVLVSHSLGGLYHQIYAKKYPEEIAAIILVDPTHPNQLSGDGKYTNWPWWVKTLFNLTSSETTLKEFNEIENTGKISMSLPVINKKNIPMTILLATEPENPKTTLEKDVVLKRQDYRNIYPKAQFIEIKGDHSIPLHSGEKTAEIILKVIENL